MRPAKTPALSPMALMRDCKRFVYAARMGVLCLLLTLTASSAGAVGVIYHFSGIVESIAKSVQSLEMPAELSSTFTPGGQWSLDFAFNSEAVDWEPGPNAGFYRNGGTYLSFDYGNGAYAGSLSGSQLNLIVYEWPAGVSSDGVATVGVVRYAEPGSQEVNFPAIAGLRMLAIQTSLFDSSGVVFTGDSIPASLNLANFDERSFLMDWGTTDNGPFFRVQGTINSVSVAAIPEPTPVAVVTTAVCILLAFRFAFQVDRLAASSRRAMD